MLLLLIVQVPDPGGHVILVYYPSLVNIKSNELVFVNTCIPTLIIKYSIDI